MVWLDISGIYEYSAYFWLKTAVCIYHNYTCDHHLDELFECDP